MSYTCMPTLISETDVKLERADMLRRVALPRTVDMHTGLIVPAPRTPGLHLSGLLKYVAYSSRISARVQEVEDEEMPLRWMLGHAFEEFAASLFPYMVWQPYEAQTPVIMNCDGITVEDIGIVVSEFKFNRAKKYAAADFLTKKWLFMMQGAGYCIGYGAQYVRWNVMSVMEWPDPVWTQYLVKFEQDELDRIANMIEINKQAAIAAGYAE